MSMYTVRGEKDREEKKGREVYREKRIRYIRI